jgi:hypothetical protein
MLPRGEPAFAGGPTQHYPHAEALTGRQKLQQEQTWQQIPLRRRRCPLALLRQPGTAVALLAWAEAAGVFKCLTGMAGTLWLPPKLAFAKGTSLPAAPPAPAVSGS